MSLIVQPQQHQQQNNNAIVATTANKNQIILGTERTSKLSSPIIQLTGHKASVNTCKFNGYGSALASGSSDNEIFLWNVYGDCINYGVLKGHKHSILELHWSNDSSQIYSCSADKSIGVWDAVEGMTLIKRIKEHNSIINSCCSARRGPPLVASASDDGTSRVFDIRSKSSIHSFKHKGPVTAVCFSDSSDQLITGGVDNTIRVWDMRTETVSMTLTGHHDTITSLSMSPFNNSNNTNSNVNNSILLSNSMDGTMRMWDLKPFSMSPNRLLGGFQGAHHNFEQTLLKCSWSSDGKRVSSGSADGLVYIWEVESNKLLYKLPGHQGTVGEVAFHPNEPIIASCSEDKTIYLGEIKL